MASNAPYDPYIPSGQQEASGQAGNQRTAAVNEEIQRATDKMGENIMNLSERGTRLEVLQGKSEDMAAGAKGFRRGTNKLRQQMFWKDMRMRICIIVGIILLLIVIIVPSVIYAKK